MYDGVTKYVFGQYTRLKPFQLQILALFGSKVFQTTILKCQDISTIFLL